MSTYHMIVFVINSNISYSDKDGKQLREITSVMSN